MSAKSLSIAILVYGKPGSDRNALNEEKYRELGTAFTQNGFIPQSISYHDELADELANSLPGFDAILVWVNPVEQGNDRKRLDALLTQTAAKGCFISTHPEVILKMGTKDILYKTKDMDWGGNTRIYNSFEEFSRSFPAILKKDSIRVLKQYRGNGGEGVYKISTLPGENRLSIVHAKAGHEERVLSLEDLLKEFRPFFENNGLLIDQEWNKHTTNGMVRCYVSGKKVAGFGYQEVNALYGLNNGTTYIPPSKRYYYTENCGLFSDLKEIMENNWIPELQGRLDIGDNQLPVIWDADFFINSITGPAAGKYTLCEINVSCVSPFPPSAITFIVQNISDRIR